MKSEAHTVEEYLAELPDDRREALEAVRKTILENVSPIIEEGMQYGMIGYYVPHSIFPAGYHCDPKQPLPYICLGSQKNYMAIHLMCVYGDSELRSWFEEEWAKSGKKLDMGKACIRFKKLDDLPLDVLGRTIAKAPADGYVAAYEATLAGMKSKKK